MICQIARSPGFAQAARRPFAALAQLPHVIMQCLKALSTERSA
jgi:hypothetical protein